MAQILAGKPQERPQEDVRIDGSLTLGKIHLSLRVISSAQRYEHVWDVEIQLQTRR
jgi:hypothetical protein